MKKGFTIFLAALLLLNMTACGCAKNNNDTPDTTTTAATSGEDTVGAALLADFRGNPAGTAQEVADRLLQNPVIQFMGGSMAVEEGLLTGFGEKEITGFSEGVMFSPMIGTIPFVGYIFVLKDGVNVEDFKTTLKDNANLRWNVCTTADEMIVAHEGNKVFFLMSPKSFDQPQTDNTESGDIQIPLA